jgi:hypothetical protein
MTNQMFILQAAMAAGILFLIINIAVAVIGLPTLTIILTNKFERKKLVSKPDLTTFELFLVILKAFIYAILITCGLLAIIDFLFYLLIDLNIS